MRQRAVALTACVAVALGVLAGAQRRDAFGESLSHSAIGYSTRPVDTPASRLNRELDAGRVHLTFEPGSGYLRSLLAALQMPVESQLLVYSPTSAQAQIITQKNPRALYFNDTASVGWVRGSDSLEIAAADPKQGTIFYTLAQERGGTPRLKRDDRCLECHLTWDTLGVPGILTVSSFPMSDSKYEYASGVTVDHRTDLDQRWGGWYVTGTRVPGHHLGNLPIVRTAREIAGPAPRPPVLTSVTGQFDTTGYLTPYSDVAALMVIAHQTHAVNLLTRLGWEARVADQTPPASGAAAMSRVQEAASDLVDYLLFVDEAPILQKIEGSSGFAGKFSALGPKDRQGRSLRQLDLEHRLLRYPCSYLIYSDAFDALPPIAQDLVYRRMWQVLSGQDTSVRYGVLSRIDRTAIVEILRDTKKTLPAYFQAVTK
jgi:hypothetical protein